MRRVFGFGLLMACSACGPSPNDFVVQYTEAYCQYVLDCADSAVLTFDGYVDLESCIVDNRYDFGQEGVGCKYNARAAQSCLDQMAEVPCPDSGEVLPLPVVCVDQVWTECEAAIDDNDAPESTDDTDNGGDTDVR